MTAALLLAGLVVVDCMLAGFRAAAGRNGALAKQRYYNGAMARGALVGVALVLLFGGFIEVARLWPVALAAARPLVFVFGAYATVLFIAFGFYFLPIGCYRALTSVIVFGPLTLVRRAVIVGGFVYIVATAHDARVTYLAIAACAAVLAVEPGLARQYGRQWRALIGPKMTEGPGGNPDLRSM